MTSPTEPLTDEQRIASLEAQLVTMRGALEHAIHDYDQINRAIGAVKAGQRIHEFTIIPSVLRSALSASADLADKVVVDREEWEAVNKVVEVLKERNTRMSTGYKDWQRNASGFAIDEAINDLWIIRSRLDALRQQGGKG